MFPRPRRGAAFAAVLLLALAGCQAAAVPEQPLDHDALLASVREAREPAVPRPEDRLTLAEAVARLRSHNPAIREARAAWQAADAVARVKTPPPNPRISLGPLLVGGTDILRHGAAGIAAGLGWTAELGGKRALQDDLNRVRANAALAGAAAAERTAYLGLRRDFAALILERESSEAREELARAAMKAVVVGRRLAEAGQATGVDVRLLELDAHRASADSVSAMGGLIAARYALAARLGLASERMARPDPQALPALPEEVPALTEIEAAAIRGHPALARHRAAYVVAEKELRLEVARAMPDFDVGLDFENEAGDLRLGLPLGLELPIWDRNQPGIAAACAKRSEARVRYVTALQRLLAGVAAARARVLAADAAHAMLLERVQPASARTLEAARASLEAGTVDALRYLEVLRAEREVAIDVLAARISVYTAWSDLEDAAGVPLLRFPGELTGSAATEEE